MQNKKVEKYELDDVVWNKMSYTMDNFKQYGDLIYSFFKGPGKKYYYTPDDVKKGLVKSVGDKYEELVIIDFIKFAKTYAKSHKDKKFVIEGVWIVDFCKPEEFKDYAFYIKGTSVLVSRWRAAKRDSKDAPGKKEQIKARFKNFFSFTLAKNNAGFEKDLNKFRDYFKKLESTNECALKLEVVDCTNFAIQESSLVNRNLYKERNLYPIYIVLSFNETAFGYVERALKNVKYSHAGLSIDSDLKNIFTFSFNKYSNGFNAENLERYIEHSDKAIISVLAIFVDLNIKNKINKTLAGFKKNKNLTKYGFKNLPNVIFNRPIASNNLSLICSEFVDVILKSAGINLTNKSSNLVIPQDFDNTNNLKVYKLYEGLAKNYNEKQVERNIIGLIDSGSVVNIID